MSIARFTLLLLIFGPVTSLAGDIMFEGYYKITLSGKSVGYNIQRYEYDAKSKTFSSISFLRVNFGQQLVQESLKAKSNDKFQPLSYQYTSQVDNELKTIDASFKGEIMQLTISDGKKKARTETHKLPKGTFLSSFLTYILMQKKLPVNEVFKYSGVAEEDGGSYWGKAWIQTKVTKGPYTVLRVMNKFKGEEFGSNLAVIVDPKNPDQYIKGEIITTDSAAKAIATELVSNPSQATEGHTVPNKVLVTLFGNMPTGKINMVATPIRDKEKDQ